MERKVVIYIMDDAPEWAAIDIAHAIAYGNVGVNYDKFIDVVEVEQVVE
jgi:hypothetical protein